jgi:hypothetical protein
MGTGSSNAQSCFLGQRVLQSSVHLLQLEQLKLGLNPQLCALLLLEGLGFRVYITTAGTPRAFPT